MSQQVFKASKELNTLSILMAEVVKATGSLIKDPSNQFVLSSVNQLVNQINSDKAFNAFIEKSSKPGMETFLSELGIRVVTKAKDYQGKLRKLLREIKLSDARQTNLQASGMGWSFSEFFSSSTTDRELGLSILRVYYDEAKYYSSFGYKSFDEFLSYAESKVEGFATNVGELVRMNTYSTSESEAMSRVKDLAQKSQGLASLSQIIAASGGSGDTVNWSAVIPDVVADSTQQAGQLVQSVGTGVSGSLEMLKYLPWIIGGLALVYVVIVASQQGSRK